MTPAQNVSPDDTVSLLFPAAVRVMIVDDEKSILDILNRAFTIAGYRVTTAENGDRALELLREQAFDIIVTDIRMPGTIDGIQLIKEAKARYKVDCLAMTGYLGDYDYETIVRNGASDFVLKPIATNELLVRVKRVVTERRLRTDRMRKTMELQKALKDLRHAYHDTIFRLVRASEYKDENTGDHIVRMGKFTSLIAERLGLSKDESENLYYAAPMHDVGKIGIPDSILLKPGKLTPEEFEIMKKHTTIGADILDRPTSDILRLAREIVLTHHEQWDGKGYPRGLSGQDIPMSGRIVKIIDVFDALTSARPYKAAYPVEVALEIISKERGVQFDPDITDVFLEAKEQLIEIKKDTGGILQGGPMTISERDMTYLPSLLGKTFLKN